MKKTIAIIVCLVVIAILIFMLVSKSKDNPSVSSTPTATIGANMEVWSVRYPDGVTFFVNGKEVSITSKAGGIYKISVPVGTKEVTAKLSGADDTTIKLDRYWENVYGALNPSTDIKPDQKTISEVLSQIKKCYEAFFGIDKHVGDYKQFTTDKVYQYLVAKHPDATEDKLPEGQKLNPMSIQPHLIDREHVSIDVQPYDSLSQIIKCNLEKQNGNWIVTEFGMSNQ